MDKKDGLNFREKLIKERFDYGYTNENFDDWVNAVPEFVEKYRAELESDKERRVLDLGCGEGRNLTYLAENGFDVYGLDISMVGLKQAQKKIAEKNLKANIQQGSFYNLPYEKDSFKAVFSNATLQGQGPEGAERTFAEVSKIIKKDGLFFVYVLSIPTKQAQLNRQEVLGQGVLGHYYYSKDFLEQLGSKNSFVIEGISEEVVDDDRWDTGKRGMWKVVFRKT